MERCSMSNRSIIGHHFFSETTVFSETLRNIISTYAIQRTRALQISPIFKHGGALPHIYGPVKKLLEQNYGKDWIGRGGPLAWPLYSPYLNPCDFYLWVNIESIIYRVPITSTEHLENRIRESIQSINENTLTRVWDNIKNRLDLLESLNSGHIEYMP